MKFEYYIAPYSERAVRIWFTHEPTRVLLKFILLLRKHMYVDQRWRSYHSYQEILVYVPPAPQFIKQLDAHLRGLLETDWQEVPLSNKSYELPVCYAAPYALDMDALAATKSLIAQEVIAQHTAPRYDVFFIGFQPGFPYLQGLPTSLHTPRKASPRREVAKGSVGIGGGQTGIYPSTSPAGWHIIGHCPVPLFTEDRSLLQAGDTLRFQPVTHAELEIINKAIKDHRFLLNTTHFDW